MTKATKTTKEPKTKKATLEKVARKLKPKTPQVPVHDDPKLELKRLVRLHSTFTRNSVALHHMASDRVFRETKEVIPCLLPEDGVGGRASLLEASLDQKKAANALEPAIERELRKFPVYTAFLSKVYGVGPIVAGYLCAYVDINRAVKPSQLQRYCGLAVIDGHFERRSGGPVYDPQGNRTNGTGTPNVELRTRVYQAFMSMRRTGSKKSTKYLDCWRAEKARTLLDRRVVGNKIESNGKMLSLNGFADSKGWHKAAQLFIYDLYLVWRSLEGLPVWTTWYEWTRGYEHGTNRVLPRENVPRMMTPEEAVDFVGNVGARGDIETEDEVTEADEEEAA